MEDGSLVRTYSTPHHKGIGIGFLSADGDAVVSWEPDCSECMVYELDRPPLSVMDKIGWRCRSSFFSRIAVTESTLAFWDSFNPLIPRLIDTTTWTEATLQPVPSTLPGDLTAYRQAHFFQLVFAKDATSLVAIVEFGQCWVVVWN